MQFHFVHNIVGLVFTKMFISLTSLSMSLFYKITMPNGLEMVRAYPELEFSSDDWWTAAPINLVTTILYGVTTISYVAWVVWTAPRRAATTANFGAKYRFCFGSLRPDCWWWVLMNLIFGFSLNLLQVVLPGKNVQEQVYTTLFALIMFTSFQFYIQPLKFTANNRVDLTFKISLIVSGARHVFRQEGQGGLWRAGVQRHVRHHYRGFVRWRVRICFPQVHEMGAVPLQP